MDKVAGFLEVGTNGRREVLINLDHDRTGHVVFSPAQARHLADLLLKKASDADGQLLRPPPPQHNPEKGNWPPATRVQAFGKYGIYSPYESHDGDVSWTVQRFDPKTDGPEDTGEFLAEFAYRGDAEMFAAAADDAPAERLRRAGPFNVTDIVVIQAVGGDLSDADLDAEIAKLEASTTRYEEADEDEVDSEEYATLLTRLTKLREERDGRRTRN